MTNLVTEVEETATDQPDATAVGFRGRELRYGEFWDRVGRFAAALAEAGVEPGDRVGVYLPNLPKFLVAFHGTLRAGGIVVPMNPQYKSREIRHMLADSGATAVVALGDLVGHVAEVKPDTDVETVISVSEVADGAGSPNEAADGEGPADEAGATDLEAFLADEPLDAVERADDDVAVQPYTSGTTGDPKGVLLTHRNIAFDARASAEIHDGMRPDDKMLGVLPLFHIYGMSVTMVTTLFEGDVYYPLPAWDAAEALELIASEGITIVHGVPAMYNDLVNHPDAEAHDLASVRFANSGGSSLPLEVMRRFDELFVPDLHEGYGLTETAPVTHANRPGDRRPGSIGQPLPDVESMVVDHEFRELPPVERGPVDDETELDDVVGELVVAGPNVMKGYYGLPDANEEAFTERAAPRGQRGGGGEPAAGDGTHWFHTGDLGYRDEDGFFFVVDREKHMIVTGGYNVYPREVEELLFEHEDVTDAAVVGVPDERRGETVKAFVVPREGHEATPEDIKRYCLDHLAEYKHPREVEFVEVLPRTTTGKVQKFELRGE